MTCFVAHPPLAPEREDHRHHGQGYARLSSRRLAEVSWVAQAGRLDLGAARNLTPAGASTHGQEERR